MAEVTTKGGQRFPPPAAYAEASCAGGSLTCAFAAGAGAGRAAVAGGCGHGGSDSVAGSVAGTGGAAGADSASSGPFHIESTSRGLVFLL